LSKPGLPLEGWLDSGSGADRTRADGISRRLSGQMQPGAFLLGQLRSRRQLNVL